MELAHGERFGVYPCPYCKRWHVGHAGPRRRASKRVTNLTRMMRRTRYEQHSERRSKHGSERGKRRGDVARVWPLYRWRENWR